MKDFYESFTDAKQEFRHVWYYGGFVANSETEAEDILHDARQEGFENGDRIKQGKMIPTHIAMIKTTRGYRIAFCR